MNPAYDYQRHGVLFVDDEQQALKYFEKIFRSDFRILTALSAQAAWEILEDEDNEIGVVVADQRMPGTTGVSLLEQIKRNYPEIVRILTTAYSDLENAMAAVNQGGAFRYVTKPWNIEELRGDLLRAMEFFLLTRDRNRLLAEKISVVQRVLIMDRARGLAALAAAVHGQLRNAMGAVKQFVAQASLYEGQAFDPEQLMRADLWTLARNEAVSLITAIQAVLANIGSPSDEDVQQLDFHRIVQDVSARLAAKFGDEGVALDVQTEGRLPAIMAGERMIGLLIDILVRRIADMDGDERTISLVLSPAKTDEGGQGVALRAYSDGPAWSPQQMASLYTSAIARDDFPLGVDMDVLAAFFIAHHHGGTISIQDAPPAGPGIYVTLACDPAESKEEDVDGAWFEMVFRRLEDQLEFPPV